MGKKKRFIDKKNSVTFRLEHRSQKDPEQANEEAPQRVLIPVEDKKRRLEEQKKYGVFVEDDYDYLQHLRSREDALEWPEDLVSREVIPSAAAMGSSRFNLPSEVFASKEEMEVGLLNLAAPESGLRLDLDPDVVAGLDNAEVDPDPEDALDDFFVDLANEVPRTEIEKKRIQQLGASLDDILEDAVENEDAEAGDSDNCSDDIGSDFGSGSDLVEISYGDEQFRPTNPIPSTQHTMSCRWARSKPHEQLLDEWSDNFAAKHYMDEDDDDDDEGMSMDNPAFQQALAADQREFGAIHKWLEELDKKDEVVVRVPEEGEEDKVRVVIKEYLAYDVESKPRPRVVHQPKDLREIIFGKEGTSEVKKSRKPREENHSEMSSVDFDSFRADRPSTYRPRDETTEERRVRKEAVKQDQAMRRQQKKLERMVQKQKNLKRSKEVASMAKNVARMQLQ